ncbi:sodium channel, voltage-gated, type IV, beta b isoform X2 [Sebastes umbrosus]|nr:sodium channel, voltage-gated, type IV, beta b isoform X2 [Sebastes umbrosus]
MERMKMEYYKKYWKRLIKKSDVQEERDGRGDAVALSSLILLLFLQAHCAALDQPRKKIGQSVWSVQALEMFVGKIPFLQAVNGSTVMLPCTYASCIGIEDLYFNWQFNDNGTMQKVCDSTIADEGVVPHVSIYRERVEFIGGNIKNNVSIRLWNITFEDGGQWTCFGRNPKEKGRNHSAIFHLIVVDELRVVDNTLTIIIASAVGGGIAALMGFMLLKNFTLFVLAKMEEKK